MESTLTFTIPMEIVELSVLALKAIIIITLLFLCCALLFKRISKFIRSLKEELKLELATCLPTLYTSIKQEVKSELTSCLPLILAPAQKAIHQEIAPVLTTMNTTCNAITNVAGTINNSAQQFKEKQEQFASGWESFFQKAKFIVVLIIGAKLVSAISNLIGNEDFYGEANIRPTDSKLKKIAKMISCILNCIIGVSVAASGIIGLFGDVDFSTLKDFTFLGNSFSQKFKNYYDGPIKKTPKNYQNVQYQYTNDADPIAQTTGQTNDLPESNHCYPLTAVQVSLYVPDEFTLNEIITFDEALLLTVYGHLKTTQGNNKSTILQLSNFLSVEFILPKRIRELFKDQAYTQIHKQYIDTFLSNIPMFIDEDDVIYCIPSTDPNIKIIRKDIDSEAVGQRLYEIEKFYYGQSSNVLYYSHRPQEIVACFRRVIKNIVHTPPEDAFYKIQYQGKETYIQFQESPDYYLEIEDDPSYLHPPMKNNEFLQQFVSLCSFYDEQQPRMERFKQFLISKKDSIFNLANGAKTKVTNVFNRQVPLLDPNQLENKPLTEHVTLPPREPLTQYDPTGRFSEQDLNHIKNTQIKQKIARTPLQERILLQPDVQQLLAYKHYPTSYWIMGSVFAVVILMIGGTSYYLLKDTDDKKKKQSDVIQVTVTPSQLQPITLQPTPKPQSYLDVQVLPSPLKTIPVEVCPHLPNGTFTVVDDGTGEKKGKKGKNKGKGRGALRRKINTTNNTAVFTTKSGKKWTFNYRNMGSSDWGELDYNKNNLDVAIQIKNALYNDYVAGRIAPAEYYQQVQYASRYADECEMEGIDLFNDNDIDYYDDDNYREQYQDEDNYIYEHPFERDTFEHDPHADCMLSYVNQKPNALKVLDLYTPPDIKRIFKNKKFEDGECALIDRAAAIFKSNFNVVKNVIMSTPPPKKEEEKEKEDEKLLLVKIEQVDQKNGECMNLISNLKDELKKWTLEMSAKIELIKQGEKANIVDDDGVAATKDDINTLHDMIQRANLKIDQILMPNQFNQNPLNARQLEYLNEKFAENNKLESSKETRQAKPKVSCPDCGAQVFPKNLEKHVRRQHKNPKKDSKTGESTIAKTGESADPDFPSLPTSLWEKRMIQLKYQEDNGSIIHWSWMHRHKKYCYVNAHSLAVPQERLWVKLADKLISLKDFNAGLFCNVGDNVFFKVSEKYENLFNTIESMPKFRAKTKIERYIFLTKRDDGYHPVPFTYVGEPEIDPASPKDCEFTVYKAKYSSKKGDSGSIIYGWDSQTKQWHPFGVHYGDYAGTEFRKILAYWKLVDTKNYQSLLN